MKAKQTLMDLESDAEALTKQHKHEIEIIIDQWTESKRGLRAHLRPVKEGHKTAIRALKKTRKEHRRQRWTPSFGQVFVTAKVESGVMIQATLG